MADSRLLRDHRHYRERLRVFGVKCGLASVEGGVWKRRFCLIAAGLTGVLTVAFIVLLALLPGLRSTD